MTPSVRTVEDDRPSDFTSSLYLGLVHPSRSLPGWDRLTTGVPAALREPPGTGALAERAARLCGQEAALLARSTLHALVDCLAVLGGPSSPVLVDAGAYPMGRWAGGAWGRTVVTFAHHSPADLLLRLPPGRAGPGVVVLTDGFCPGCGRVAPLAAYAEVVRRVGGRLVVDDSQAFGVLGSGGEAAYGSGGGGSLRWTGVSTRGVVLVASFAKAFGVPLALVAASADDVARLREGPAREHGSGPSAADLAALDRALSVNASAGDRLRARLAGLVTLLRSCLARTGVVPTGGLFPVQSLPAMPARAALEVARRMAAEGVIAVPTRPVCRPASTVSLLVRADHTDREVDRAAAATRRVLRSLVLEESA